MIHPQGFADNALGVRNLRIDVAASNVNELNADIRTERRHPQEASRSAAVLLSRLSMRIVIAHSRIQPRSSALPESTYFTTQGGFLWGQTLPLRYPQVRQDLFSEPLFQHPRLFSPIDVGIGYSVAVDLGTEHNVRNSVNAIWL
jgi:hypothetical protein